MSLKDRTKDIPSNPGVYFFKDKKSNIIYIGKAKNLKKRVSSYFNKDVNTKNTIMVSKASSIDFLVVENEVEALLTEANMIKEYKPKYNIFLKDDKTFPYIVITNEPYPKVEIIRKKNLKKDGNIYFGPYTDVGYLREVVKALHQVFQIRTCSFYIDSETIKTKKVKVCLDYHIKKCEGPCEGFVSQDAYNLMIQNIIDFLKGKNKKIRSELVEKMNFSSKNLLYEEASRYRDQIKAIDSFCKRQKQMTHKFSNRDILHASVEGSYCVGIVMRIRNGLLIGREQFNIKIIDDSYEDVMNNFLIQYYTTTFDIPSEIIINKGIPQSLELENWLFSINNRKVSIVAPLKGDKRKMIDLCIKNTEFALKDMILKKIKRKEYVPKILNELKDILNMPVLPKRIEAFDNSNLQGTNPVAGLVCFVDGKPLKKQYRCFNIKTVKGIDDFESMREVVNRRYARQIKENKMLPDLILIDGGKGQLSAAKSSLDKLGLGYITVIGLAKKLEEVFVPGNMHPQNISKTSSALYLLRKIRDEVHRYSISFHRKKRNKNAFKSIFDEIDGMGPTRIKKIWNVYNTLDEIKKDSLDEVYQKTKIPKTIIRIILDTKV